MKYLMIFLLALHLIAGDDENLILLAYESGLQPVPARYTGLMLLLNEEPEAFSAAKIALGKKLFFDRNLSLGRDVSCASCHRFDKGGADGRPTAVGHLRRENPYHLNTPTVFNTAFSKKLFWDGRSETLEDQARGPLQAPFEMAITPKAAERRVRADGEYDGRFRGVYGGRGVTFDTIVDAIAAYEKTLQTRGRYDDFLLGYTDALNAGEKEGLKFFITKGCVGCHNGIGLGGQAVRKFPLSYHRIWSMGRPKQIDSLTKRYGLAVEALRRRAFDNDAARLQYLKAKLDEDDLVLLEKGFFDRIKESERASVMTSSGCSACHTEGRLGIKKALLPRIAFPFENRGGFTGAPNRYFRVPLLRNAVKTAPYFHNGSVEKLEEAIKVMGIHQLRTNLSENEIGKIVAFLRAADGAPVTYDIAAQKDMRKRVRGKESR
ncbi:cytochrome-c peroxidase [Sulfurimonas diazotrophicus]|uniref:Cytochrome c peroxidase n=1 Tax=Sulfurimonas diazotrophicus TaxID=3131939 RepID=A0ABZ3H6W7_9BACT